MISKKTMFCCLVLVQTAAAGVAFARPLHVIPFSEQLEKADLVVIAHPVSATVHKRDPRRKRNEAVEVTTDFKVEAVIKGDAKLIQFTLLHHEYNDPVSHIEIVDGAGYIRFTKNDERPHLMFLKKTERGEYVPYCGQYDAAVSIRVMQFASHPGLDIHAFCGALERAWEFVGYLSRRHEVLAGASDQRLKYHGGVQPTRGEVCFQRNVILPREGVEPVAKDASQPFCYIRVKMWLYDADKPETVQPATDVHAMELDELEYHLSVYVAASDGELATELRSIFSRACASWTENGSSLPPMQPRDIPGAKPNAADSRTEKGESPTGKGNPTAKSLGPADANSKRASVAIALAGDKNADVLASYPSSRAFDANTIWHRQVDEQEIRMSYFSRGDTKVAVRGVADLSTYQVTTSREVHDHATQSLKKRSLSHSQVLTLRGLTKRLTASDEKPALENLLIVSFVLEKERHILAFDVTKPPPDVIRLYDLTGAYLPAAADERAAPPAADTARDEASRKLAIQLLIAAGILDEDKDCALFQSIPTYDGTAKNVFVRVDVHERGGFLDTPDLGRVPIPGERKRACYLMWSATKDELLIDPVPLRQPSAGYGKNPIPDGWLPIFRSTTVKKFRWQQDPRTDKVNVEPAADDQLIHSRVSTSGVDPYDERALIAVVERTQKNFLIISPRERPR